MGFATQDTAAVARLMTANYRFQSADPRFVSRHPIGLDPLAQLDSIAHLPGIENGDTESSSVPTLTLFCEFPDTSAAHPSEPRSKASQVVFDAFTMTLNSDERHDLLYGPAPCTFVLVRGDSARLGSSRAPDAQHWYVAGWTVGAEPGRGAEGQAVSVQGPVPVALGIRRMSPTGAWPIILDIALPSRDAARIQMFDLSGRRVLERSLVVTAPGTLRFALEDEVGAGVYWLRVLQSGQKAGEKIVIFR